MSHIQPAIINVKHLMHTLLRICSFRLCVVYLYTFIPVADSDSTDKNNKSYRGVFMHIRAFTDN